MDKFRRKIFNTCSPKIEKLIRKELNEKEKEKEKKTRPIPRLVRDAKETQRNVFN